MLTSASLTACYGPTCRLGDTCGVHYLHGIPGILGGLVAGFVAFSEPDAIIPHGNAQLGYQIAAILVTMGLAIVSGVVAAMVVTHFNPRGSHTLAPVELFEDGVWWTDTDIELPAKELTARGIPTSAVDKEGYVMPMFQASVNDSAHANPQGDQAA